MPFANGNASVECLMFACEVNDNYTGVIGEYSGESVT